MYVTEGVLETVFLFLIPAVDATKYPGYLYTMIVQYILIIWAMMGCICADLVFMVFVMHTTVFADLFKIQLKELGNQLKDRDAHEDRHRDDQFVKSELYKIYKEHQAIVL